MKELLRSKLDAQAALVKAAIDAGRAMTDDEQSKYDSLEVEIKAMEKTIDAQAKIDARAKEDNTPVNTPLYAEPKNSNKKLWSHSGEFLMAVKNAGTPGGTIDNRLFVKNAATGLGESINSDGGFLVESDFVKELMTKTYEVAVVANRTRKIPIGPMSNGIKIPAIDETSRVNGSRYGGIQAYWTGEGNTPTASKPKVRMIDMDLEKLMALCYITGELMNDSTALEAYISQAFVDEMAFKLDDALINGTGAGMPLGVLNAGCTVSVAKEAGQAATTVVYENVLKMWARMWARSRQNAVWFVNQDIEPQLHTMSLAVGTGGIPVYMPAGGIAGTPYSTLFGRPVVPIEQCATVGTVGDIILADMSQYLVIEKGGVQADNSIHVRFLYDENTFRFMMRVNGQPMWNAALTPFKGTNTQSPFITLATRS